MRRIKRESLIQLYYGEDQTLQQIGDKYGVTRERIRQRMEQESLPRDNKRSNNKLTKKGKKIENTRFTRRDSIFRRI